MKKLARAAESDCTFRTSLDPNFTSARKDRNERRSPARPDPDAKTPKAQAQKTI
jgi:hypothetical protein